MNREFVPYEIALELQNLGFKEEGFGYYDKDSPQLGVYQEEDYSLISEQVNWDNTITAPIYQQAFRFFREKYNIFISIVHYSNGYAINDLRRFDTYEEAELECLKQLIKIAKQNL